MEEDSTRTGGRHVIGRFSIQRDRVGKAAVAKPSGLRLFKMKKAEWLVMGLWFTLGVLLADTKIFADSPRYWGIMLLVFLIDLYNYKRGLKRGLAMAEMVFKDVITETRDELRRRPD